MTNIYILLKDNIPFYVGKSKQSCITRRKHKHYATYGNDIKLEIIDEIPSIEWKFWEKHYISLFKSWGFTLLNKNNGGGGPTLYVEEFKQKMRKPHKDGTGAKISATLIANNHSKYYTNEIKQKMSNNMKGTHGGPFTSEHLENIKISRRKTSKRVLMYDLQGNFIKEWASKGEAAEWIKNNQPRAIGQNVASQIKDSCYNRIYSCWGYIWKYKDSNKVIIPKFKTIYQYNFNKEQTNVFYNLNELKNFLSNKNNYMGIISRIKNNCNNNTLGKVNGYYYSYSNSIL
jgi:hypothetical protein